MIDERPKRKDNLTWRITSVPRGCNSPKRKRSTWISPGQDEDSRWLSAC